MYNLHGLSFTGESIKKSAGFNLIAPLIVMANMALLTVIGCSPYQTYIAKIHMDVALASLQAGETTTETLIQKQQHATPIDATHPGPHTTHYGSYVQARFDNTGAGAIICTPPVNRFIDNLT
ncbi:hypothetical protein LPH50_05630 [Xylella taiwanensis]|uniref:hypothetical protein n=1 Tax=Xylella taiwanensis TaxID=1444770 RepID=UPI00056DF366|nr:hypothetical protein [Xylella taiwanensis]MCD8459994.1 hypothetical protein [Xylella taiwanensis]MCD8469721.1 hypothetical protein [Xylella taiwanensis]QKD99423.1 hypothetical protein PLS229_11825 [Xylella taiwanensis]UFN07759.1 hypothetical protein LPH42_05490 [Xylella taiwanensis]UFN10054.1 hypothetical protein LPH45_05515 [Xylella taiwanensis]